MVIPCLRGAQSSQSRYTKKDDILSSSVLVYLFEGLSRFDGLEQEAIVECGPRATTRQESDAE